MWLQFRVSNNEAEYEAFMMGLRASRDVGATYSQLVVQQIEGAFEVKDEKLWKYCEAVECNKEHFMEMRLK